MLSLNIVRGRLLKIRESLSKTCERNHSYIQGLCTKDVFIRGKKALEVISAICRVWGLKRLIPKMYSANLQIWAKNHRLLARYREVQPCYSRFW